LGGDMLGSLALLLKPDVMYMLILGCFIGFIFGIMPGLGGLVGLSIMIPFTTYMESTTAMYLFAGIIGSGAFGGSIPAILIRVPGSGINIASSFDGYPMTQRGEGDRALGIAAVSSGLGAIFGIVVFIFLYPIIRIVVLSFSPPEFFMLILWGMVATVVVSRGSSVKGLISVGLGVVFSLFGTSPITTVYRWDFGTKYLQYSPGLPVIPILIGLFAIGQMLSLSETGYIINDQYLKFRKKRNIFGDFFYSVSEGIKEVAAHKITFLRSSAIGTFVGIIPGIGGAAATYFSYLITVLLAKNRKSFGQGNPEGLIAAEAANDAKDGGALLTTLAFGIPGSLEMAVIIGALMTHGIAPGPMLMIEHSDIVWSLIIGLLIANILVSSIGLFTAVKIARISTINPAYLIPTVVAISFIGAYMYRGSVIDVAVAMGAGFLSYGLEKYGFPLAPLAIAFVLGRMLEVFYHQSLQMAWGEHSIFITRPISLTLFIMLLLTFSLPVWNNLLAKKARVDECENEAL
jgi:putative tricarboxylic transport membrane protein